MCKNSFQLALYFSFTQDVFKQATEDRLTSAKELPYFEGDFWPNVLEESIKELEQEEEERKREENNTSNESTDVSEVERWLQFLDHFCHKMLIIVYLQWFPFFFFFCTNLQCNLQWFPTFTGNRWRQQKCQKEE